LPLNILNWLTGFGTRAFAYRAALSVALKRLIDASMLWAVSENSLASLLNYALDI
jgi:hypothetical protein